MTPKTIPEIVDLASAFYGSATLFAALDLGVFAAIAEAGEGVALAHIIQQGCGFLFRQGGLGFLQPVMCVEGFLSLGPCGELKSTHGS